MRFGTLLGTVVLLSWGVAVVYGPVAAQQDGGKTAKAAMDLTPPPLPPGVILSAQTDLTPPPAPARARPVANPLATVLKAAPKDTPSQASTEPAVLAIELPPAPAATKAPPLPRSRVLYQAEQKKDKEDPGVIVPVSHQEVVPAADQPALPPAPPAPAADKPAKAPQPSTDIVPVRNVVKKPTPPPVVVPATVEPPLAAPPSAPPVAAPDKAAAEISKPTAAPASTGAQRSSLLLDKIGPATVAFGRPIAYEIVVRNGGAATLFDVHVQDELPDGARLLKASPPPLAKNDAAAARDSTKSPGTLLTWNPGNLDAGAEVRIKVEVQPKGEGEFKSNTTATFSAASSLQTRVVQPRLAVAKSGPETVQVGDKAVFTIEVANTGSGPATGVVLHDHLPSGLKHPQGLDIEAELGTLAPGETRTLKLETTAVKTGRQVNEAIAMGDNNLQASAKAVVVVTEPGLGLRQTGPQRRFLGREAEFDLEVINTGTAPAANVVVTDTLPPELEFVSSTEGGVYDPAKRTVTWPLGQLDHGQRRGLSVKVLAKAPGDVVGRAVVRADRIAEATAEAPLHIEGVPALMLEVRDLLDPVEEGRETTYEIRVVNQGSAASKNVKIVATAPTQMTPKSAEGPTGYRIQGQQVIFEPFPKLAARADLVYRVKVLAKHPGDLRFKVELTGDQLDAPVYEEENTHVYNDVVGR